MYSPFVDPKFRSDVERIIGAAITTHAPVRDRPVVCSAACTRYAKTNDAMTRMMDSVATTSNVIQTMSLAGRSMHTKETAHAATYSWNETRRLRISPGQLVGSVMAATSPLPHDASTFLGVTG